MRFTARSFRGSEANVLVWSSRGRAWAWSILLLCFGLFYAVPLATIALASVAGEWNSVLPSPRRAWSRRGWSFRRWTIGRH